MKDMRFICSASINFQLELSAASLNNMAQKNNRHIFRKMNLLHVRINSVNLMCIVCLCFG